MFQFQDTLSGPVPTPVKSVPPTFVTDCILCLLFQWLVSFQALKPFSGVPEEERRGKAQKLPLHFLQALNCRAFSISTSLIGAGGTCCNTEEHCSKSLFVPVTGCFLLRGRGNVTAPSQWHRTQLEIVLYHCQDIFDSKSKCETQSKR